MAEKMTSEEAAEHQRTVMNAEILYLEEWAVYQKKDGCLCILHTCGHEEVLYGREHVTKMNLPNLAVVVQKVIALRKVHICED